MLIYLIHKDGRKRHKPSMVDEIKKGPSIIVGYYETKVSPENEPRRIAQRCSAEIISLGNQLNTVSQQLTAGLRRRDINDVVDSTAFNYENFLFRVYSLRERVWDVLAALATVDRSRTGDKKFRELVLATISNTYPELYKAVLNLQTLIASDLELRNVGTHQTFLILGITYDGDSNDLYDLDSAIQSFDPKSKVGKFRGSEIRKALGQFTREQRSHIEEIQRAAFDVVHQFHGVIDRKVWN